MKKLLYLLVFTLYLSIDLNAAASVAICGWDGTSGDKLSFVLLRDFSGGEVIYFTEDEYVVGAGNFNSTEGHLSYTFPAGGLFENDVVSITETNDNTFSVGCAGGSAVIVGAGNWSFTTEDELYAYSASNPSTPWSSVTEVHCFIWFSNTSLDAGQIPTDDWPQSIVVAFNIGGPSGINANFLDGNRANTTIPMFQSGSNWSQSSGAITLSCTDFTNQMLPIELVSFDAQLRGDKVLIDWVTATELNNERFEIEHSTDGRNFTRIGTEFGKGTSLETNYYQMIDSNPNLGKNYYRLKQIDYDGAFSYSDILVVKMDDNGTVVSTYPNPFNQTITIQFPSSEYSSSDKVRKINIYDIYGKLAFSSEVSMNEIETSLDLSRLNSGAYFIHTLDNESLPAQVQRIIKL